MQLIPALVLCGLVCLGSSPAQEPTPTGRNEAVELVVATRRLTDRYGVVVAPKDHAFLVLATEWRNLIPTTEVDGKLQATPYLVPDLQQQLFLVVDGGHIAPFAAATADRPGVLPRKAFKVPDPQIPTRGNLVFEVPGDSKDVVLSFLDDRHGAFALRLLGDDAPPTVVAGPGKNELVEAFVAGQRLLPDAADGAAKGAATETLALDLRLRSVWQPDPAAKCPNLVRWPDWRNYVQLLVDGDRAVNADSSPLDDNATILPVPPVGGEFRFRVPKSRTSLELALYFPELPTRAGRLRPQPIVISITGGERAASPERPALLTWADSFFACKVVAHRVATLAERPATVLSVEVRNAAKTWEVFQPYEQLALVDATGHKTPPSLELSRTLPTAVDKQVLIPPGQTRLLDLAYPAAPERARLMFASADPQGSKVLELPKAEGVAPTVAGDATEPHPEQPREPAEPDTKVAKGDQPATPEGDKANPGNAANPGNKPPEGVAPPPAGNQAGGDGATDKAARRAARKRPAPPATLSVRDKEFPTRVPIHPQRQPKGIAGYGITPERLNAAIDRGADGLWDFITKGKTQHIDFNVNPRFVLCALALVHARFHERNAEFDAAVRDVLTRTEPFDDTYETGLLAMLVSAYGSPDYLPLLRACTEWLVNTQLENGSWDYRANAGPGAPPLFTKLPEPPRTRLRVEGGTELGAIAAAPVARFPNAKVRDHNGDNSVTQYALLGLDAAQRCALPIAPAVWQAALDLTQDRQAPNGGFSYTDWGSQIYGSMTAAGVCAMALTSHYLGQPIEGDEAIERGLAWLNAYYSLSENPAYGAGYLFYWVYSVERVGRILDTEFLGEHEWYPDGVQMLLGSQMANGCWQTQNEDEPIASSFALLFLTRATPSFNAATLSGPGRLVTTSVQPKGRKLYIVLDASGSMLESIGGKNKFDLARDSLLTLVQALPPETEVALRVYGHRKRAIEPGANEDCELIVPLARLDLARLEKTLRGLRARGKTPMALSLEQAAGEVARGTPERPVTLLLLTDGGEDTQPRRDPVAAAKKLANIANLRFKIVGFDIERDYWSTQLQAMAEAGHGVYLPAMTGEALVEQVRFAALEQPGEFRVRDGEGRTVASGRFGATVPLPAGEYEFEVQVGSENMREKFKVRPQTATRIVFDSNAPKAPMGR